MLHFPRLQQPIYFHKLVTTGLFQFIFLVFQSIAFGQTTYYIATTGSDSNNGQTAFSPFQSLAKVNSLYLQPGDSVLFRRGDTFRGTLIIRQSGSASKPIVFDTYGSGQKPIVSGSAPLSNWTNIGNNIWQASCSDCGSTVTGLYDSDTPLPLGRYPNLSAANKGYLTIRAHTEKYQIFSQEHLPDTIDWKGGEVVMRSQQWILDRAVIDHQYGDALNLFNYSNYSPSDGWGYFIQSHPATLDQQGEWYYDPARKLILLLSDHLNPNLRSITATIQSRGVDIAYSSNIILGNLTITQTLNQGVFATNVSSFTLANNDITNSGEDGITIQGTGTDVSIVNNRIIDVNNNGVWIDAFQHVAFKGNSLRRIGIVAGRGKGGDGQYIGLQSTANQDVLIEKNIIDSVGYNGVTFWNNTTIQQNVISNYCMIKSDGGALYVWNNPKAPMANIHIISNIIYNGIGALEGSSRPEYSGANGIFLDDCVENVELKNNTVFNNLQWGIYLHATSNITLVGNTSFDNGASQFVMYHDAGHCPFRNNLVKNNTFVSKLNSQFVADFESDTDDLFQYGLIDSNYYARPFNESNAIFSVINYFQGGTYSLSEWKNFSRGLDLNSKSSPITYNIYKNDGAGGINRINSAFDKTNDGWALIYSRYNNGEVTQDTTNKLDDGSLRIGFTSPSGQTDSYAQATKSFAITKGKTYVLRFDAVATVPVNVLVYLRQSGPPYQEYDKRYSVSIDTTRKSYELPFTATASDTNAVVLVQIDGEGPTFWLDNVRLQEGAPIKNDPDEFIKLFYNPTQKDSVISLTGIYRDVKNQSYTDSVILKPFTSIILLKDALPALPADLSLSLESDKRVLQINEPATIRLRVSNQSTTSAELARWTYRLPANLQFLTNSEQPYSDNVLTGTIPHLAPLTDTTFTFMVKPTKVGVFRTSAQITTATSPDPDSTPNSGTADGEDDAATVELRVGSPSANLFESPNPNQRSLPTAIPVRVSAPSAEADLSLRMTVSHRTPVVDEVITYTIYINNAGGIAATEVQLEDQLPDGLQLIDSTNWSANGQLLSTTLAPIPAYSTLAISFQARVTLPGVWINLAQVNASNVMDPDSTPGNGFTNGEDDQAQIDVRCITTQ